MELDYSKLWKILESKNMTQTDLQREIKCSSNTIGKMKKNQTISMLNLMEICQLFNCQISDIVEIKLK